MLIHVVFSNSIQRDFHPEGSEDALQMTYCLENPCVLFVEHIVSGMRLGSHFLPYTAFALTFFSRTEIVLMGLSDLQKPLRHT